MRYHVLACDYDGTLAAGGRLTDSTVKALEQCLDSGRSLVLVTGRELQELLDLFPRASLFEWIVAENGGLLYRPATRTETLLGPPADEALVEELRRRGVAPLSVGRVIVATREPHEMAVLRAIHDLGLEHQVIFNKGAVMILPPGVNKATGLHAALAKMEISHHNVIAIGDAENDHALLASCEAGIAVANAVTTLKDHADFVTAGDHCQGVAELVRELIDNDCACLAERLTRHHIVLGQSDGQDFCLAPYRGNVLVIGSSGGGKTSVATALIERLTDRDYQVCIVDPEGDYDKYEAAVPIGTAQHPPDLDATVELMKSPQQSVKVSLLGVPLQDRPTLFVSFLARVQEMRARRGHPHWLLVDEAHHVWPGDWAPGSLTVPRKLDRTVLITLEANLLPLPLLQTVDLVIAVGEQLRSTLEKCAAAQGVTAPTIPQDKLAKGDVLVWMPGSPSARLVTLAPARSQRQRHIRKYAEGELEPQRSFYFRGPEGKLKLRAQNLILFLQIAEGIDAETWLFHLRQGDFSKWFRDNIKDPDLAEEATVVEADQNQSATQSLARIRKMIEVRYTLPASPATPISRRRAHAEQRGRPLKKLGD